MIHRPKADGAILFIGPPFPSATRTHKRRPPLPQIPLQQSSDSVNRVRLLQSKMSSGFSNGTRLFRAGRTLFSSLKSTTETSIPAAATTHKSKGKLKSSVKKAATDSTKVGGRGEPNRSSGIFKSVQVSPALGGFLGISETSRSDAVKQIWSYIKLHNLQNPADKREIHCDERLKAIFDGREKVGFLEIGKLLSPHFVKSD